VRIPMQTNHRHAVQIHAWRMLLTSFFSSNRVDIEPMLPLLPIIPIPTGRKYETVVTGEGSILGGNFYAEFFAAVDRNLAAPPEAPELAHYAEPHGAPPSHALSAPSPEAIPKLGPAADQSADASSLPW
jgi:hypothetical protein